MSHNCKQLTDPGHDNSYLLSDFGCVDGAKNNIDLSYREEISVVFFKRINIWEVT